MIHDALLFLILLVLLVFITTYIRAQRKKTTITNAFHGEVDALKKRATTVEAALGIGKQDP